MARKIETGSVRPEVDRIARAKPAPQQTQTDQMAMITDGAVQSIMSAIQVIKSDLDNEIDHKSELTACLNGLAKASFWRLEYLKVRKVHKTTDAEHLKYKPAKSLNQDQDEESPEDPT